MKLDLIEVDQSLSGKVGDFLQEGAKCSKDLGLLH